MKKIITVVLTVTALILLVLSLTIKVDVPANGNERIVLDHTYHSYIAPNCFEDSEPTNFLEEATLDKALELNYAPHTACTEEAFAPKKRSLLYSIFN